MEELGFPAVATSGNLSEEPICTEEADAIERFREIADGLLVHNRPIVRPIDDSVARVMADRPVVFRRARGYSPLPIELPGVPGGLLAVGGHLKNAVAVTVDGSAIVGQHVGDLDTVSARDRMETEVRDLSELHQLGLVGVVHDLHPDYASTRFAEQTGLPLVGVQHHIAHAAACLAENEVCEPALAVVWDGTGFGLDGSIWGGEFFLASTEGIVRAACIRPFWLPGGEAAMREPRRSALGLLWEAFGHSAPQVLQDRLSDQFSTKEIKTLRTMLKVGKHCVRTSSTGRLFDAFAALGAGIGSSRFEGDAPMRFENLADGNEDAYPMSLDIRPDLVVLNWRPTLEALAIDLAAQAPIPKISSRFHKGLAEGICLVAAHFGLAPVALSGGCFQNRLLFEETWRRLTQRGFRPYGAQRIPPGDGGLAFGQMAAHRNSWEQRRETPHTRLLET
jgi:hydrogenase maturation protein HypF